MGDNEEERFINVPSVLHPVPLPAASVTLKIAPDLRITCH